MVNATLVQISAPSGLGEPVTSYELQASLNAALYARAYSAKSCSDEQSSACSFYKYRLTRLTSQHSERLMSRLTTECPAVQSALIADRAVADAWAAQYAARWLDAMRTSIAQWQEKSADLWTDAGSEPLPAVEPPSPCTENGEEPANAEKRNTSPSTASWVALALSAAAVGGLAAGLVARNRMKRRVG